MSVRIITDSACDITQAEAKELGITVIPLKTIFGMEEFRDGVDITPEDIYAHVAAGNPLCSTSAIPVGEYEDYFAGPVSEALTAAALSDLQEALLIL